MEAVIRIPGNEFDENLFAKIKLLVKNSAESEVIIKIIKRPVEGNILQEPEAEYWTKINRSINEIDEGKGVIFTMKEFEEFISKNFPE